MLRGSLGDAQLDGALERVEGGLGEVDGPTERVDEADRVEPQTAPEERRRRPGRRRLRAGRSLDVSDVVDAEQLLADAVQRRGDEVEGGAQVAEPLQHRGVAERLAPRRRLALELTAHPAGHRGLERLRHPLAEQAAAHQRGAERSAERGRSVVGLEVETVEVPAADRAVAGQGDPPLHPERHPRLTPGGVRDRAGRRAPHHGEASELTSHLSALGHREECLVVPARSGRRLGPGERRRARCRRRSRRCRGAGASHRSAA